MPPDADKLRQRHTNNQNGLLNNDGVTEDDTATTTTPTSLVTKTLDTLQSYEIAIDGIVYDIRNFKHPGGESINIFGGNDVTTQYKMIHPFHNEKHLEKLQCVGTVPNYSNEYKFDTPFEREMKEEVFKIVKRGNEYGTYDYFIRAIFYIVLFFYLQYLWVSGPTSYTLACIYGVSMALIGLNVQHDANHGAAGSRHYTWINDLLGLGADFIGGSKWLWMEKHWTHHTYTNHKTKDPDGFAAEPMLLFNDYPLNSTKRTWVHTYQAFYFVIVLAGYWISAVFNIPEIYYLQDSGAKKVGISLNNSWIQSRVKFALPLRILYLITNVIMPFVNKSNTSMNSTLTIIGHINVMGIAGSLALGLLFTLSHNFEHVDRNPTNLSDNDNNNNNETETKEEKKEETKEENDDNDTNNNGVCWFKSQVETSSTYGGHISGWLTGGLNFQIEHHLFPRMSSAWYPYIAPTVRRVCKKHNVRYVYYPWVWQNMISTLRYTHTIGNGYNHLKNHNPFKGEL